MPKWVLKCDNCNSEFTHSMITDQSAESFICHKGPFLRKLNSNVLIAGTKTRRP